MLKRFDNYIGGEWKKAASGRSFEVRNPARHDEVVAICQEADARDVEAAVMAAQGALPAWSAMNAPKRGSYLKAAAGILARRRDEAAELLTREEGKPIFEARGEVDRSVALLEYYAAASPLLNGETFPSTADGRFLYTLRVPMGVAALITPWNFPSAIPVWKSAPALLCGNTVVLKPASLAPASAALLAEVYHEAGLPKGVFNFVSGGGRDVGDPLVSDARVKLISFTGSLQIGRSIVRKTAERLVRVGLEMGGKNPHIIMPDADLDRAVTDVVVGAFWAAGHKCTACSRAIVLAPVYDAFVKKLVERTATVRVGDGLDEKTQVGPVIDEKQLESILEYVKIGKSEGATLAVGGQRLTGGAYDRGWFMSPAVFTGVRPDMRIAREEIFGPVLSVIKAADFDEAIRIANDIDFGLSAGIATSNIGRAMDFARRIDAGVVHVNSPTAGLELQLPFGGCKCSTSGYREMGKSAIDFYTQTRTVYVDG